LSRKLRAVLRAKGAVSHTVQEEETERGKLRFGREGYSVHGTVAWKGIEIIKIKIKHFGFA